MELQFDPRFSIGNVITICIAAAGIVSSFAVAQYQIVSLGRSLERVQSEADERAARLEVTASAYESRIRAVEIAQASQTSDLRSIQAGINEIKDQVRRLTPQP